MTEKTLLNDDGLVVEFDDYKHVVIPRACLGLTNRAYDDLYATANERESITVENGNVKFKAVNNCLIDTAEEKIVLGCKNSVIPNDGSIKIIGHHAFIGIGDIESEDRNIFTNITIPDSVEVIEHHAFADSGLTDIELPYGLKEIGSMAFMLTRIGLNSSRLAVPYSVEKMGIGVFMGCKELKSVRLHSLSERYVTESDCIVDTKTKTVIAVHNGSVGEMMPYIADTVEAFTFVGQKQGTKYYFDDNITNIKVSPLGLPSAIEFPITIVAPKNSYAHKFAIEHNIDFEDIENKKRSSV